MSLGQVVHNFIINLLLNNSLMFISLITIFLLINKFYYKYFRIHRDKLDPINLTYVWTDLQLRRKYREYSK
jgi:hypothetical protein